jgi:glutamate dehydrogenase (NAD(P)+)
MSDRTDFLAELNSLQASFDALEPELCATIRDPAHGVEGYVVEGANNPCTAAARALLHERGIDVVPDFIANPGGAIAAFVELTSDVSDEENARTAAKVDEAKHTTRTMVSANVAEVLDLASSAGASPVDAASLLALRRVFGTA